MSAFKSKYAVMVYFNGGDSKSFLHEEQDKAQLCFDELQKGLSMESTCITIISGSQERSYLINPKNVSWVEFRET